MRTLFALVRRAWEAIVDRYQLYGVRVRGIEVTQAIQYYGAASHLTDANDRGADNSVRLVARKAAWVRVYVRSGLFSSYPGVGGELVVARRILGFFWQNVATLAPQAPGTVTAYSTPDYPNDRANIGRTLNFVVPADTFSGNLRLTVRLTHNGVVHHSQFVSVDATLLQTLRIRAILVSYNGPSTSNPPPGGAPNLNLAAPTLANLQATAALALRMMPVQANGVFQSAGNVAWNLPLDDPRTGAGGCSANWNQLLTALTTARTNDGNRTDVVYYGLLPAGIPLNVPGCGQGGLGSAANGNQTTLVHEIGHGYGFMHTPCGNVGASDANYPVYEPYPSASIGEYGLDISNGNVFPPAGTFDYMSYCGPRWMSLYQHNRLIQHARLDPRWVRDEPWWKDYFDYLEYLNPDWWLPDPPPFDPWMALDMRRMPMISIIGRYLDGDRVEVANVARLELSGAPQGIPTRLTASLIAADGAEMARGVVYQLPAHGGGCGCAECGGAEPGRPPFTFQAFVPDTGRGAALIIKGEDGEPVWERKAPATESKISEFSAQVRDDGSIALQWRADAGGEYECWLQWSSDGRGWHGLATALTGGEAVVSGASLPAGEAILRLLLHDGFATAISDAVTVRVPVLPPHAAILHPAPDQSFRAGAPIELWASVTDQAGAPVDAARCQWELDGKDAGRGTDVWTVAPQPGKHRLRFFGETEGGAIEQTVEFVTYDVEQ